MIIRTGALTSRGGRRAITLLTTTSLGSQWTFSRASQGTQVVGGVLSYAPNNLLLQSQTFTSASWAKNASAVAISGTAPDGSVTANLATDDTSTGAHSFYGTAPLLSAGSTYTLSAYLKAGTQRYISMRGESVGSAGNWPWLTLDTTLGTITNNGVAGTYSSAALASGWYRVSMTFVSFSTVNGNMVFAGSNVSTAPAAGTSLGNGYAGTSLNWSVWGAQLELNTAMGPYSPTTTAAYYGPRFETSPAGWLGEPQATNIIRNNTMQGAVVGSPGTIPTNWSVSASNGLVTSVAGIGTLNGINYIDLRFAGTTTNSFYVLTFDGTSVAASPGQVWAESLWVSMIAGSLTNLTTVAIDQRFNGSNLADTTIVPNATFTRYSGIGTAGGTATNYNPALAFSFSTGVAIDVTLRIGLPQAELSAFSTSAIATTTTAATRAADNLTFDLTQLPGLQTATGYSAAIEFSLLSNTQSQVVFGMAGSGGFSNTWYVGENGAGGMTVTTIVATVGQTSAAATLRAVGLTNRLALTVTPTGITYNLNGAGDVTVANVGMPVMTTLAVLRAPWGTGGNFEAGHATLVTLFPGPQSAAWRASRSY